MVGIFVKSEGFPESINSEMHFPFSLQIGVKKKKLYASSKEDREDWIHAIRQALGYSNLFTFYDLKVN